VNCCSYETFELAEELGHVEAVDWDLGRCRTCGSYVLQTWSPHAPDRVFYDRLTAEEGARFAASQGRERVQLLKQWYNDH
jgi:hypothetical protein